MKNAVLLTSLLAVGALAAPSFTPGHVLHDKRNVMHPHWVKRHGLASDSRVPLKIAMKGRNLEEGGKLLMEVSDPDSSKYGQHLSQQEVADMFAPDAESVAKVVKWLKDEGIAASHITVSKSNQWIKADVTASQLEDLLKTKYHTYRHVESRNEHIGTDKYHLPRDISKVVDFISPSTVFQPKKTAKGVQARNEYAIGANKFRPMPHNFANAGTDSCDTQITPDCIKAMYNIPEATDAGDPSNFLGVFETSDQTYLNSDLDAFYKAVATKIPAGTAPAANLIDGAGAANDTSNSAGGEITLDLDIAIPIVYPQGVTLYQTVVQQDDIFDTFLDAVDGSFCKFQGGDDPSVDGTTPNEDCGTFKPANVFSISYGWDEASYPNAYLQRQCQEFMKLGLQGTSIVISSGDDGVARRGGPCLGPNKDIFTPNTAASCPYSTTVGATTLPKGSKVGDAETATDEFSSGGGFSNVFLTPDYQKDAVSTYLTSHDPGYKSYKTSNGTIPTTGGIYNAAGRGYPDISAVGQNGVVVVQGQQGLSGGTSMAAPLIAAIFTRINDERIKAGKGPIGFANPVLYKNPDAFTDIVKGNQALGGPNGDTGPSACGNKGFSAVAGWDPVTGLGTPVYDKLLAAFLA